MGVELSRRVWELVGVESVGVGSRVGRGEWRVSEQSGGGVA